MAFRAARSGDEPIGLLRSRGTRVQGAVPWDGTARDRERPGRAAYADWLRRAAD